MVRVAPWRSVERRVPSKVGRCVAAKVTGPVETRGYHPCAPVGLVRQSSPVSRRRGAMRGCYMAQRSADLARGITGHGKAIGFGTVQTIAETVDEDSEATQRLEPGVGQWIGAAYVEHPVQRPAQSSARCDAPDGVLER